MKKIIYVLLVFIHFSCCIYGQIGFAPEIGIGASTMHFQPTVLYTKATSNAILSGKIGGGLDIPMNNKIYLQSGFNIALKGNTRKYSYSNNDSFNESINQTLTIGYFEIPINVIFKTKMQGLGRLFFGLGANPAYIIGGSNKLHANGTYSGIKYDTSNITSISAKRPLGGFDIGLNVIAGYEMPTGLYIKAYYTAGVNDIGLGGEIDKNRMWGIALGYFFGKGRNINKDTEDLIDKGTN